MPDRSAIDDIRSEAEFQPGDHVRMASGETGCVIKTFPHGEWVIVRYDHPQPYKDGLIRNAAPLVKDLERVDA